METTDSQTDRQTEREKHTNNQCAKHLSRISILKSHPCAYFVKLFGMHSGPLAFFLLLKFKQHNRFCVIYFKSWFFLLFFFNLHITHSYIVAFIFFQLYFVVNFPYNSQSKFSLMVLLPKFADDLNISGLLTYFSYACE